jgi:hypothetical protein
LAASSIETIHRGNIKPISRKNIDRARFLVSALFRPLLYHLNYPKAQDSDCNRYHFQIYLSFGGTEMTDTCKPINVQFPLRGEWLAPTTPGTKIPSHGSNKFGTRYAYDFVQVAWHKTGRPAYRGGLLKYLTLGIPICDYYCWGQPIYAPGNGVVVESADGYPEREQTNLFGDLRRAHWAAKQFDPRTDDVRSVAGNFVVLKLAEDIYAALCHLQTGSIQVTVGQTVKVGEVLGRVGHSGNSFAPHLHFQLMDSSDIAVAQGLPCAFSHYEVYREGVWLGETAGVPTRDDRLRSTPK